MHNQFQKQYNELPYLNIGVTYYKFNRIYWKYWKKEKRGFDKIYPCKRGYFIIPLPVLVRIVFVG